MLLKIGLSEWIDDDSILMVYEYEGLYSLNELPQRMVKFVLAKGNVRESIAVEKDKLTFKAKLLLGFV